MKSAQVFSLLLLLLLLALPAFAGTAAGCAVTESTGMTADAAGTTTSTPSRARPGIFGERRRS